MKAAVLADGAAVPAAPAGTDTAPGRSGTSWYRMALGSIFRSVWKGASRKTSVSATGASVTARSPPSCRIRTTRPTALLVTYMTFPTSTSAAPAARPSIVQVSPSGLADRMAPAPPSTRTTSD
ncbi:hypothetical protein [Streptomyces sp. 3212.3]|uniref:hypothetical protein n=1 Tax=Streptomyces sp. 3212.3 TaxID=1938846 RepID=UPI0015F27211|nr:hypothetical protein [Streptomyces sp. 3212.3]